MFKLTKNIMEANLITHGGTFHPDDVFSTIFMSKIIDTPCVCRLLDTKNVRENAIIYDIGYGEFDHHGPDAKWRNEKIKYSINEITKIYRTKDRPDFIVILKIDQNKGVYPRRYLQRNKFLEFENLLVSEKNKERFNDND